MANHTSDNFHFSKRWKSLLYTTGVFLRISVTIHDSGPILVLITTTFSEQQSAPFNLAISSMRSPDQPLRGQ